MNYFGFKQTMILKSDLKAARDLLKGSNGWLMTSADKPFRNHKERLYIYLYICLHSLLHASEMELQLMQCVSE